MKRVKLFEQFVNETIKLESQVLNEWGSSDQNIMNKAIHKDAGSPKKMPSPFDSKLRAAAEDAVDFYWDDWKEYQTDRDGLIDNAVRSYLRSYFKKDFEKLVRMFESVNENLSTEQKMVEKLLKKIAKEFDYSMQDAARFVLDTIGKMGLKESMNEEATEVTPDSKVVVDDYMLDDAETKIKSTEIIGAIVSSESEDEFLEHFYKAYGNTAFTENDISTLIAYYQEYREEVNAEETEKEQEEEDAAKGGDAKDPLADLGI